ncbi:WD40-repeat-containing domain protein [Ganoderma leucocontextum]|nr:WD40-repeat-containing domain protein [Ganoderma leucocontextum]
MFSSLYALSGILLSFPRIRSLSCATLDIREDGVLHQELIQRRVSVRLGLNTLTIGGLVDDRVLALLLEVAKHTLARLNSVDSGDKLVNLLLKSSPSEWVHLGSFVWQIPLDQTIDPLSFFKSSINRFITGFEESRPPKLREVTVVIHFRSFRDLFGTLLPSASSEKVRAELETTLLTFPQPTLSFSPQHPLNVRRDHSWREELGKFFPTLARRHALTLNAESWKWGHDGAIWTTIVVSRDSRWAATGSEDGTIIIWDTENGCIAQEWSAHPRSGVRSLSLSPDTGSRYLLSAGCPGQSIVWDLRQDPRGACMSLADREDLDMVAPNRRRCAWSAEGSWIASESRDRTVHLWDAHTFQRLHPSETWEGELLASSPDGRWIVTSASPDPKSAVVGTHRCHVWNVESGKLHRELRGHAELVGAAAFDPGSTRIVTLSDRATICICYVETGEELLVLKEQEAIYIRVRPSLVVYSPDGTLVLSSSSTEWGSIDHPGGVKIWDASTGALLAYLARTLDRFSPPYPACFSPCGRYVASASEQDGEVCLWRTSDWSCVATVSGGRARVTQVAISPDGRVLCCGAEDGTVFFRHMCDLVSAEQYP